VGKNIEEMFEVFANGVLFLYLTRCTPSQNVIGWNHI